jgi:hypothetical protein
MATEFVYCPGDLFGIRLVAKAGCDITDLTASVNYGASTSTQWAVDLSYTMVNPALPPHCFIGL